MTILRGALCAFYLVFAAGCTTASYPPLQTNPNIVGSAGPKSNMDVLLEDAHQLQVTYAGLYKQSARYADYGQLPLIGLAAASAVILLTGNSNASDVAGYLGIGAAAYGASRNSLFPQSLPDIYMMGHTALSCIRNEGYYFVGDTAEQQYSEFDLKVKDLKSSMGIAQMRYSTSVLSDPTKTTSSKEEKEEFQTQKATYQKAMADLNDALTAARPVYTNALTQLNAHRTRESVFGTAISTVAVRVATKGREGRSVDFDTLLGQFSKPETPQPARSPADGSEAAENEAVITRIVNITNTLKGDTGNLKNGTPTYDDTLKRVSKCPESIT